MNKREAEFGTYPTLEFSKLVTLCFVIPVLVAGCAVHPQLAQLSYRGTPDQPRQPSQSSIPARYQRSVRQRTQLNRKAVAKQSQKIAGEVAAADQVPGNASEQFDMQNPEQELTGGQQVLQASFQQPTSRTYSNPPHQNADPSFQVYPANDEHGFPPNGFPQLPHPAQHPLGVQNALPSDEPILAPPLSDQTRVPQPHELSAPPRAPMESIEPPASRHVDHSLRGDHVARDRVQVSQDQGTSRAEIIYPSQNAGQSAKQDADHASSHEGSLTHLADGIQIAGSHLHDRALTATERALQLKQENDALRLELAAMKARVTGLSKDIKRRDKALAEAERLTQEARRANAMLRDSVAVYKVRLQDAEKVNQTIQQNADNTLEEIEATLDAVLVNTLSGKRNR